MYRMTHTEIFLYNFPLTTFPASLQSHQIWTLLSRVYFCMDGIKETPHHYEEWDQIVGNGQWARPPSNSSPFTRKASRILLHSTHTQVHIFDGLPGREQYSQPTPTFHPFFSPQNYHRVYFSFSRVANGINQKAPKSPKLTRGHLGAHKHDNHQKSVKAPGSKTQLHSPWARYQTTEQRRGGKAIKTGK